jgi:hypothetical protein
MEIRWRVIGCDDVNSGAGDIGALDLLQTLDMEAYRKPLKPF